MGATFAGRVVLDPREELDNCRRHGFPTDWADLANSFTCPLGVDSGRGFILMYRGDLDILANTGAQSPTGLTSSNLLNVPNNLTLSDNNGTSTFHSLHIVKTRCITP